MLRLLFAAWLVVALPPVYGLREDVHRNQPSAIARSASDRRGEPSVVALAPPAHGGSPSVVALVPSAHGADPSVVALSPSARGGDPSVVASSAFAQGDRTAAARQKALTWLHAQQLPDGSFGPRIGSTPQGSPAATADAAYALALLGEDPGGPAWSVGGRSALDALARLAGGYVGDDAGQAGKVARAVAAAGRDPRNFGGLDLLAIIRRAYDPATGRYNPDLLYRHTLAIEALARAGEQVPAAAFDALWQARMPDGGWFWAFTGEASDVDTTGRVVFTLASFGGDQGGGLRCAPALVPAAAFLARQEAPSGDWGASVPPGPPNTNSTALSLAGLAAAGYDLSTAPWARAGRDALAGLLAFQEPGGAFVYINEPGKEEVRLAATLDALTALVPARGLPACNPFYLPALLAD